MLSWLPKIQLNDERKKKGQNEAPRIIFKEEVDSASRTPRLLRSRNIRRHWKRIKYPELLSWIHDNEHSSTHLDRLAWMPGKDQENARLDRLPSVSEPASPRKEANQYSGSARKSMRKSLDEYAKPQESRSPSSDFLATLDRRTSPGNSLQANGSSCAGSSFRENQGAVLVSQSQSTPTNILQVVQLPSDSSSLKENRVVDRENDGKEACEGTQITMSLKPANVRVRHRQVHAHSSMPTSPKGSPDVSYSSHNDNGGHRLANDHEWTQERAIPEGFHRALETPSSRLSGPKVSSAHKTPIQSPRRSSRTSPIQSPRNSVTPKLISPLTSPRTGSPLSSPRLESPQITPIHSPRRSPLSSPNRMRNVCPDPWLHAHDDPQRVHAHPLPLPPDWQISPSSAPRSPAPTAPSLMNQNRIDDSGRFESPSTWHRNPGKSETSTGKWIKGAHLGSGSFGKVYKGIHSETGDLCAIKEVELVGDDPKSNESAKQLSQEIVFLSALRHPNILHYKGSEMVGTSLYIYLELVSGGSIYKLLREIQDGKLPEPVVRRYTRQILLGLEYLHGKNTVHRDVKCANVLVDQDGVVKLADFGVAKFVGEQVAPLSFKGSPYWIAPEVILQNNSGHELAVDIWSLGCTVIEMATGSPPWSQYEGCAAMFKVMNSRDVPIPDTLSPMGQDFVRQCLQRDPAKRPSATRLLSHRYMQLDIPVSSNGATLSQAVVERITLRDRADRRFQGDRAVLPSSQSSISTDITPHYERMAISGPVSPQRYFQAPLHTSHSEMNLLRQNPAPYNHGNPRSIDDYSNQYGEESSRSRTAFPSRRFTGGYGPSLPYSEQYTVRR